MAIQHKFFVNIHLQHLILNHGLSFVKKWSFLNGIAIKHKNVCSEMKIGRQYCLILIFYNPVFDCPNPMTTSTDGAPSSFYETPRSNSYEAMFDEICYELGFHYNINTQTIFGMFPCILVTVQL